MVTGVVLIFGASELRTAYSYTTGLSEPISLSTAGLLTAIVCVGLGLSLSSKPLTGLALLCAFTLWQASLINPLQRGLGPLADNPVRHAVEAVSADANVDGAWLPYSTDPIVLGSVTATGVNSLAGVSIYPDREAWRALAPRSSSTIWNRYALVTFEPGRGDKPVLARYDASVAVRVDPCAPVLDKLRVRFVLSETQLREACLSQVEQVTLHHKVVTIYRRESGSTSPTSG
jgi:hypothetical protein